MNFTVIDYEQGSPEWLAARAGRLTGTAAADMLDVLKDGKTPGYKRRDLLIRLACEQVTNAPQENGFVSAEMRHGTEKQPDAIAALELHRGYVVRSSGFLSHTEHHCGCSLDGHVGDFAGIVEVKCPKSATHWRYLRGGVVPFDYLPQITHNLWISGSEWCDFASFDDRFPPPLQLFVVRISRESINMAAYEAVALSFLREVEMEVAAMRKLMPEVAVA